MKINDIIEQLEIVRAHVGNVECLVEVVIDGVPIMEECGHVSYDRRDFYGPSVAFLANEID